MKKAIAFIFCITFLYTQNITLKQPTFSSAVIKSSSSTSSSLNATAGESFAGTYSSDNAIVSVGFWGSVQTVTLDIDEDGLPTAFSLSKAYPNPFNPVVNIDIEIPNESEMEFYIYNLLGNLVFKHNESFKEAGKYQFRWNGLSNNGTNIPTGIYIIAMRYDSKIHTQKITFLK